VITRIILIRLGKIGAAVAVTLVLAGAFAGCGGTGEEGAAGAGGGIDVVAGFYPLAFAAEQIGGPLVRVRNLTPVGAEPHDLELSPRDVARIHFADLVLYLGHGFQPALEDAAKQAGGRTLDLLDGLELSPNGDPHVWLDPVRYARIAERIGKALGRAAAASRFADRVKALDHEYRAGLADCKRREIVTSHAAFGYLAGRYGLEQVAVTGLAPEAEPGPRDLARVARLARERGATTIFFEPLVSRDIARTVAHAAGAEIALLDPLEGLTRDEAKRGEDYFSIMRRNLATLRVGLGCR
jgi:zinc transport system substrate-binding protein